MWVAFILSLNLQKSIKNKDQNVRGTLSIFTLTCFFNNEELKVRGRGRVS